MQGCFEKQKQSNTVNAIREFRPDFDVVRLFMNHDVSKLV